MTPPSVKGWAAGRFGALDSQSLRRQLGLQLLQPVQHHDHRRRLRGARLLDHQEPLAIRGDVVGATMGVACSAIDKNNPGIITSSSIKRQ